jgi:GcrA cell cycle regulator
METGEMSGPSPWTEERLAMLRAEWATGDSTAEIGRRMGISKNAVIGKARRMELPAREAPANIAKQTESRAAFTRSSAGRDAISPRQSRPVTTCRPSAAQPGAAASTALDVSSFRNLPEVAAMPPRVFLGTECKFPLHGDERPVVPRFCAEPVRHNAKGCASPYCAAHYAECYAAPGKYPTNPPPATWLKNRGMVWARG